MREEEILKKIAELSALASEVLKLKRESRPRRPIVIEFCGSPKSGKTSCISSLNIFLKRNGFKTKILTERASVCPITDKFDPMFNIWTVCSAIAELANFIKNYSIKVDIIIADRAIFDALCWFGWQLDKRHLDKKDFNSLKTFLTMKRWRTLIDLIYVFDATPEVSLKREYANLLTREIGSVMNQKILGEYRESIHNTSIHYKNYFRRIESIDTSEIDQNGVSSNVTNRVLNILKDITVEQIGYFNVNLLFEHKEKDTFNLEDIKNINKIQLSFENRDKIEENTNYIQPIPIAVITNKKRDRILALKKTLKSISANSPEKNKLLLYAGGHSRAEDSLEGENENFLSIMKQTLSREITEELGIPFYTNENNPLCIWMKDHDRSRLHLAICFIHELDFEDYRFRLNQDEFVQKTGTSKSGKIFDLKELTNELENMDSWSRLILSKYFGVHTDDNSQLSFFDIDH